MYRKIGLGLTLLIILLVTGGCFSLFSTKKEEFPTGNVGSAGRQEKENEKIIGEISGEIELPELSDDVVAIGKPMRIKVDGAEAELPSGTKGKLQIGVNNTSSSYSWNEFASSWKINSAPVQLFVFGGVIVAVGIGLIFFGLSRIGIAAVASGAALIACGVVINSYPWVILIIVGLSLIVGGYFLYTEYRKKKLEGETIDQFYVLERITDVISKLPNDIIEKYIKAPLKEDDNSGLVRKITRKARGLDKEE